MYYSLITGIFDEWLQNEVARLGIEMTPITALIGSGTKRLSMSEVEIRQAADYAGVIVTPCGQRAVRTHGDTEVPPAGNVDEVIA